MFFVNKKRKKITVASTISASGLVKAGGSNAMYGLYTNLAEYFDIEIIYIASSHTSYYRKEIVPGLIETAIPKTSIHANKEQEMTKRLHANTAYDLSLLYFLDDTPNYGTSLRKSISTSDLVMIDRPYLFYEVKKYLNGRPLIHHSQNIEFIFKKSIIPESDEAGKILNDLFDLEKKCYAYCTINFACSSQDLELMNTMYKIPKQQLRLLPNGVDCKENPFVSVRDRLITKKKYALSKEKLALFIGGGNKPNIEACEIILKIAPFCKDTKFIFAGNLCNTLSSKKLPENTLLLGPVTEETRKFLFSVVDIALNPMYSGSGSNIKMFDYMAMGIPIITSSFGARGIHDISAFCIADTPEELISAIHTFHLNDKQSSVAHARHIAETVYDWHVIAQSAKDLLLQYMD